jgi:hypothetical protein
MNGSPETTPSPKGQDTNQPVNSTQVPPSHPNPGATETSGPGPEWIEQHQQLTIIFAVFLILFYMAPVFVIAVATWTTGFFSDKSNLIFWFAAYVESGQTTLGELHQLIFPMISGLSVIILRGKPTKSMLYLIIFILFAYIVTFSMSVIFDMDKTLTNLTNSMDKKEQAEKLVNLSKPFFKRVKETLMMYLGILIGIRIADRSK